MVVPVYVMFTKVDLVAGFVEFWGDLRKSERAQIWGRRLPLDGAEKRDPARAFDEEFDALVDARARARLPARRARSGSPSFAQRIYQFPLEFAALKQNLQDFVGALFTPNNFQDTPILRGIYFSSGTQEGRPIDRVIGGMMRAFNLPGARRRWSSAPQGEAKSYFVTDVFRRVVFPDQNVAASTRGEQRRQFVNRVVFAVAALGSGHPRSWRRRPTPSAQNMSLVSSARRRGRPRAEGRLERRDPNFLDKVHKLDDLGTSSIAARRRGTRTARRSVCAGACTPETARRAAPHRLRREPRPRFATPTRAQLEHELSMLSLSGASHLTGGAVRSSTSAG